jgi:hypothetical protein
LFNVSPTIFPLELNFEDTSVDAEPAGWTANDNRTNLFVAKAMLNDASTEQLDNYTRCVFIDASGSFGGWKALGEILPDDGWRIEVGWMSKDPGGASDPYFWTGAFDVAPFAANIDGIYVGLDEKLANQRSDIAFAKDGVYTHNYTAQAEKAGSWTKWTRRRIEFTKGDTDVLYQDTPFNAGDEWTDTQTYTAGEFDDTLPLDKVSIWGAASSGTYQDAYVAYIWIGRLTDTWPTKTVS